MAARFLETAEHFADRPAMVLAGREPVSYAALAGRVNAMRELLQVEGIRPDTVVGVAMEDPADWVPTLLAVLAEGAVYLVLDPRVPEARLCSQVEDSTAAWTLCSPATEGRVTALAVSGMRVVGASSVTDTGVRRPVVSRTAESVAFLTYTSGSTGAPKGVAIRHANILHEVAVHTTTLGLSPDDRLTGLYPPSTVGCTRDLYAALLCGASVSFFPFRDLGFAALRDWMREQRLTRYHSVPPIFRELMQELGPGETLPDLRTVFLAGDRVAWSDLDLFKNHTGHGCRFYTGIGTSETSSLYAHGFVEPDEPRDGPILPSGTAVPGVTLSLLDASGNPAASGEPGEIVVEGRWLAAGYWRRDLRAPHPFPEKPGSRGDRLHRTGDHATLDRQGRLLFQGRRDQQVKILGNRIDLSEVDLHLRRLPGVREVAVHLIAGERDQTAAQLTAFVSWKETALPLSEIRRQLLLHLPAPAVPTRFHWLTEFPRLANGKLDSRELGRIAASGSPVAEHSPTQSAGAPETPAQRRMAQLWRDSLGVSECGTHDSFFELGGNSLAAMRLLARIRAEFPGEVTMRMLFDAPTVAGLLDRMGNPEWTTSPPSNRSSLKPPRAPDPDLSASRDTPPIPLASHAQERLWFLDALEPNRTAYVMPDAVLFRGPLDATALERALHAIVKRHESLRTVFSEDGGVLFQVVQPAPDSVLEVDDLSRCAPAEQTARVETARTSVLARPFSLAKGPLYRFRLLQLGNDRNLFLRAFHHIIADGWSVGVFHRELATAYAAEMVGEIARLPELRFHYADLSTWQRQRLEGPRLQELLNYWTHQLEGAPPRLELPRDASRSRGPVIALNLARSLKEPLSEAVTQLSRSLDATPFMVLLATFQTLLGRLSGEDDVVVGTPTAGRSLQEAEPLIGFFVSTIALRTRLSGNPSFRELVRRVRDTVLDAQEHQELPFEKLIAEMRTDRDARHHPVFQVLFNLISFEDSCATLPCLESVQEPVPSTHPKFDLTLYVIAQPGSLILKARYASDLFRESTIARMLAQFEALVAAFAANPELPIGQPSLILPGDHTILPAPGDALKEALQPAIHAAFAEQAQRNPARLAIRESGCDWSYGDLDLAARRISIALRSCGLERGTIVGVVAVSCAYLVAALIGILRAGGRFLVLDAAQAPGQLRRMMALSQPKALLLLDAAGDADAWRERLHLGLLNGAVLQVPSGLQDLPSLPSDSGTVESSGADPAYLVFTSGSTGEPLGILGDHGPVSHFLEWQRTRFGFTGEDRFSLLSGLGHDPLLRDLFAPLSIGASLHIPPPGIRESPEILENWFRAERISVTHITPPLAQVLSDSRTAPGRKLTALRWVFLGGDRLTGAIVSLLGERAPSAGIVNFYGTTETPQAMAFHEVVVPGTSLSNRERVGDPIPLGKAIPGVQLLIWNAAGHPAGIGEPAEILVRTPYLSSGYLGAPERAQHRFVSNPVTGNPADRVYRTGDLGYFLADGSVVYLRRIDHQIKLRGYRIEPDEVRTALRKLSPVEDAAVVLDAEFGVLHAYLVLHTPEAPPTRESIRNGLRGVLPDVAIPARFFAVASLPLTLNGKLDFRSLVHRTFPELQGEDRVLTPRTAMEAKVQYVWQEILGRRPVGIHDNFFDLGGHSLLALRLVIALRERLGLQASLADLLANPSVGTLAELLVRRTRGESPPVAATPASRGFRGSSTGVPWIHVPGVMGFEFLPKDLADVIGRYRPYHDGLQYPGLNGHTEPERTVAGIAAALITQVQDLCPQGPLWLSGYSMGGMVAHELARQLEERGRPVERVVLFDVRYIRDARRNPLRVRLRLIGDYLADRSWRGRVRWIVQLISAKLCRRQRHWRLRRGWANASAADRLEAAGWKALTSHTPQPYHGPVTLLRATRLGEQDTARLERDRWNGWGPWAHPGFEIMDLECDHCSIFLEPVARTSVEALESLLERTSEAASKSGQP